MPSASSNDLVIRAIAPAEVLNARQSLGKMKRLLVGLEKVSPWRRPFDVSGTTKEHGCMPIAADLSNFDEVAMIALRDASDIAYRNPDPKNIHLTLESYSPYGFFLTFTDCVQRKKLKDAVSVAFETSDCVGLLDRSLILLTVPQSAPNQVNSTWSRADTITSIINYIIDFAGATECVVYAEDPVLKLFEGVNCLLGWLTFTRNPAWIAALAGDPHVRPYRNGVLITVGDDARVMESPEGREQLIALRDKLLAAGAAAPQGL